MKEAKIFFWTFVVTRLKVAMTLSGEISLCSDLKTVCIDGGYCSEAEGQDYSCQCQDSSANCETKVSDLCFRNTIRDEKRTSQNQYSGFCINEGRCSTSGNGRLYCDCQGGTFTGPHCELSTDRFLQLIGIPTASPTALNSTNATSSLSPATGNQSDAPNSQTSLAPSPSNGSSLAPSFAPSIGSSSSTSPSFSASPSASFSPSSSTISPSLSIFPTLSLVPTATWYPTGSALPTITSLPTLTAIPSTSEPTSAPSALPSGAPSIVVTTTSPTGRPVQERQPIPGPPPFVAPTPRRTDAPISDGKEGLQKGASVGIGLLAVAIVSFSIVFYCRRRRYTQAGRIGDGDLELTTNYLDDHDGWANQRPLTAGTRHDDGLI